MATQVESNLIEVDRHHMVFKVPPSFANGPSEVLIFMRYVTRLKYYSDNNMLIIIHTSPSENGLPVTRDDVIVSPADYEKIKNCCREQRS